MLEQIVQPLCSWYEENRRILPWREQKNPYYIWVSEIMLQQTRVEAVKPYFERFIKELPDVRALAECEEARLLKLWEGLGYYNRVRNMQKAAVAIMEKYQGKLPADYEKLLELPGIGSYTAGAVASIAYDIPVPAVDGNVLRVIARLRKDSRDILKQSVKKSVEKDLQDIMPLSEPGIFNQALMELGAMVCVPNGMAKCDECPVHTFCQASADQTVLEYPVKSGVKSRRIEKKTVILFLDGNKVAIRKRPSRGLLAGLYEFPNYEGNLQEQEVLEIAEQYGLTALRILPLDPAKHIFSHVEWRMTGYMVRVAELEEMKKKNMIFVEREHAEEKYPVPAAFASYAKYVNVKIGQEKYII